MIKNNFYKLFFILLWSRYCGICENVYIFLQNFRFKNLIFFQIKYANHRIKKYYFANFQYYAFSYQLKHLNVRKFNPNHKC
jgi:hypothetical protein